MDMHTNDNEGMNKRSGTYNRRLRASDADREAMAARLRQHYTEGRLDAEEYNERIERCYATKTVGELDDLLLDLPRTEPQRQEPDRTPYGYRYRPPWRFAVIVPFVVALIIVSALTGAHLLWLAWPLFFFVFGPFGRWCRFDRDRRRGAGTT